MSILKINLKKSRFNSAHIFLCSSTAIQVKSHFHWTEFHMSHWNEFHISHWSEFHMISHWTEFHMSHWTEFHMISHWTELHMISDLPFIHWQLYVQSDSVCFTVQASTLHFLVEFLNIIFECPFFNSWDDQMVVETSVFC